MEGGRTGKEARGGVDWREEECEGMIYVSKLDIFSPRYAIRSLRTFPFRQDFQFRNILPWWELAPHCPSVLVRKKQKSVSR